MLSRLVVETNEFENVCPSSDNRFQDELLADRNFMAGVRSWLKTEELRRYFDFVTDMPREFLMENAGERFTQERIASWIGIDQSRIPSLNKSLRRAFKRQIRVMAIESQRRQGI